MLVDTKAFRFFVIIASILIIIGIMFTVQSFVRSKSFCNSNNSRWGFDCIKGKCKRYKLNDDTRPTAMNWKKCAQICGHGNPVDFWPKPWKGWIRISEESTKEWMPVQSYLIKCSWPEEIERRYHIFFDQISYRFHQQIKRKLPSSTCQEEKRDTLPPLEIVFKVEKFKSTLSTKTNESYEIYHHEIDNELHILARSIFGIRHGLETVAQLIFYDDITNQLVFRSGILIGDNPGLRLRGIMLDTGRNYFTTKSIERLIDTMAMVKLNCVLWMVKDTQSFPIVIKSHPYLSRDGAFSPEKVYTAEDIKNLTQYAYYRGVYLIPRFIGPDRHNAGWQSTNFIICKDKYFKPNYCTQTPCGMFDPLNDKLYDVLEDVYREIYEMFNRPEFFDMEIDMAYDTCFKESKWIQDWIGKNNTNYGGPLDYYYKKSLERFDKFARGKSKIILRDSSFLKISNYNGGRNVITIENNEKTAKDLAGKGFDTIVSIAALHCGPELMGTINQWECSPYKTWNYIYNVHFDWSEKYRDHILGGRAELFTTQTDEDSIDEVAWPRCTALAELLWSIPKKPLGNYEQRMHLQQDRFVENGIDVFRLSPQYCIHKPGRCQL